MRPPHEGASSGVATGSAREEAEPPLARPRFQVSAADRPARWEGTPLPPPPLGNSKCGRRSLAAAAAAAAIFVLFVVRDWE